MSIQTQTIEIINPENPLETSTVVVPVHKHEKVYCNEPYVLDAIKKYSSTFGEEELALIRSYEGSTFKNICEGMVSSYNEETDKADIVLSPKHSITLDLKSKHTSSIKDQVEVGKTIEVVVAKAHGKMVADATSKAAQLERLRQELIKQIQSPTSAYAGTVKDIVFNASKVFNGFIVDVNGVQCFMPGSESDVVPLEDYNTLLGATLYVMPVAVAKDSIIVSHKEYLNTLRTGVVDKLIDLDKSNLVSGVISSVKPFGVFILIESCVPTLLSVSEMNEETESKFKAGELKVGDNIEFYLESITDTRVTVTQTISKSEGWEKLNEVVDKEKKYKLIGVVKNTFDNGIVVAAPTFNNITFFLSSKVIDLEKVKLGAEIILDVTSVDTTKKTVRIFTE